MDLVILLCYDKTEKIRVKMLRSICILHTTGMDFLAPLKHFRRRGISVNIDNIVFKANYKGMVFILILAAVLVSARQFIGKPISCHLFSDVSNRPIANDVSKILHSMLPLRNFDYALIF